MEKKQNEGWELFDPSTHVECKDEPQPITFKLKKLLN